MLVDTHCHLDQYSIEELVLEIDINNIYITMGTSSENWFQILELHSIYPHIIPALGLHPWYVSEDYEFQFKLLTELISKYQVSVMGEIGLDFSSKYSNTATLQLNALTLQLELASQNELPISLHVIKAHNPLISLLKQFSVTGVIHGLGSSVEMTKQYLDLGFKIGVNGVVVRENARRYHHLVQTFGVDALVLETDSPNILLPNKSRSLLVDIYQVVIKIAELTGLPETEIIRATNHNAQRIFNLKERL